MIIHTNSRLYHRGGRSYLDNSMRNIRLKSGLMFADHNSLLIVTSVNRVRFFGLDAASFSWLVWNVSETRGAITFT